MRKVISREVTARGRFDLFLDSGWQDSRCLVIGNYPHVRHLRNIASFTSNLVKTYGKTFRYELLSLITSRQEKAPDGQ